MRLSSQPYPVRNSFSEGRDMKQFILANVVGSGHALESLRASTEV